MAELQFDFRQFSIAERDRRWKALRELMARDGIDAIVASPHKRKPNVRARGYAENFAVDRRGAWTH